MGSHVRIRIGLILICCAGCDRVIQDPQEEAWKRLLAEDDAYLNQHDRVVSKVRQAGGEVTAFGEKTSSGSTRFSLVINFSDKTHIDNSVLKGLLDGSPVKLLLRGTSVTDAGLAELANDPGIEILDLYGTSVSDVGCEHISTLSSLTVLGLGNTQVTDKGMVALSKLSSLEQLSLPNDNITDDGVMALRALRNLRRINLDGTKVTDAVIGSLAVLKDLQNVWLSGTQVTPAGAAKLERSIPNCTVHLNR